jgi:NADPH-dependent 2,4-dienoyl-CoA reductase/sulfur reductase-like enzyme
MVSRNHVEMRLGTVVREFNIERRLAVLQDGQVVEFRKALLATGSRPRRPQVAGATLGNVFYLNSARDALAIRETAAIEKNLVVIGDGLIALEAAAALTEAKCKVTLMGRQPTLWRDRLDAETSQWLTNYFEKHGVKLMLGQDLNGFEGKTILKNVQTKRGDRFPAQMALVALGADPNLELVHNTPLSSPNGTPVNELLETDEKGIFAAGDIALFPDRIFGGVQRIQHWENAKLQGHIAGQNMTGKKAGEVRGHALLLERHVRPPFRFHRRFLAPAGPHGGRGRPGPEKTRHPLLPWQQALRPHPLQPGRSPEGGSADGDSGIAARVSGGKSEVRNPKPEGADRGSPG